MIVGDVIRRYMGSIRVWCLMWAEDGLCHGMVDVDAMR